MKGEKGVGVAGGWGVVGEPFDPNGIDLFNHYDHSFEIEVE